MLYLEEGSNYCLQPRNFVRPYLIQKGLVFYRVFTTASRRLLGVQPLFYASYYRRFCSALSLIFSREGVYRDCSTYRAALVAALLIRVLRSQLGALQPIGRIRNSIRSFTVTSQYPFSTTRQEYSSLERSKSQQDSLSRYRSRGAISASRYRLYILVVLYALVIIQRYQFQSLLSAFRAFLPLLYVSYSVYYTLDPYVMPSLITIE